MSAGWLLDTSVLAHSSAPEVVERLRPLLRARLLYTCPWLDLEALAGSVGRFDRHRLEAERREAYRRVPFDPDVGERALALQARLEPADRDRVLPGQLLVAATALRQDLGVLHYAPAFGRLGVLCGLRERAVVPFGVAA